MKTQNQKYIERFENLIRVMRGLSRHERTKHFDMDRWCLKTQCGTSMCAAGFAGRDPWFRRRGFKTVLVYNNIEFDRANGLHTDSWGAIEVFFGDTPYTQENVHPVFTAPKTVGQVIKAAKAEIKRLQLEDSREIQSG